MQSHHTHDRYPARLVEADYRLARFIPALGKNYPIARLGKLPYALVTYGVGG